MKAQRNTILTLVIFVFIAILLIIIEARPNFPDPDSFYHAKMALIIRDQGFIQTFPWLQWTSLKDVYVNPHLLYHVVLIPFVTWFDPLVGMKISAVVFGLLAFLSLFLTLRAFKIPWAAWLTLAAALSSGFMHRMSLPRAPALAVALLLPATWAMLSGRPRLLFVFSALMVWLYHGWPVLFLSLGAVMATDLVFNMALKEQKLWLSLKNVLSGHWKNVLAVISGALTAMVLNPYFPQNIKFVLLDIFKIGVVNYQSIIRVGNEWYPLEDGGALGPTILIVVLFLAVLVVSLALFRPSALDPKKIPDKRQMLAVLSFVFLAGGYTLLTFKSSRFMEYAVPFLVLAAGAIGQFAALFWSRHPLQSIKARIKNNFGLKVATTALCLAAIGGLSIKEINEITERKDYFQESQYEGAVSWIKEKMPAEEIIFHNGWDFSLILFYLDDKRYYLVGLDPTFMYDYNSGAYNLWWDLVTGERSEVSEIEKTFHSRVVIIDKRIQYDKFAENLEASGKFQKVREDDWTIIYANSSL